MPKRARSSRAASAADLRAEFWRAPDEALLDRKTAAAGLGYTVGWLEWVASRVVLAVHCACSETHRRRMKHGSWLNGFGSGSSIRRTKR